MIYFDIQTQFLEGNLLIAEAEAVEDETEEDEETEEVEKEFIPAMPRLAKGAKTYTNRNGYKVFHGYKYSDIPGNEHLELAQERMVSRNARRRYTGGASNFRETNYRKATYASDMKPSARTVSKPTLSRKSLTERKELGYSRNVKTQKTRIQRYSLRQSLRDEGVAVAFKRAKEQKRKQQEIHSALWAQNRTQRDDPALRKDRSRIDIKQVDSRKELLEYYEEKRKEEEEFQKNLEIELYGAPVEDEEEETEEE